MNNPEGKPEGNNDDLNQDSNPTADDLNENPEENNELNNEVAGKSNIGKELDAYYDQNMGNKETKPNTETNPTAVETKINETGEDSKGNSGINNPEIQLNDEPIPLNSALIGRADKLVQAKDWIKPLEGWYDVIIHGTSSSFEVLHNGEWVKIDQRSLATYMKKTGYNGEPVRLMSCGTGGGVSPIAQDLSNKLGVKVMAPTDTLWIHPNGNMTIGQTSLEHTGSWNEFSPGSISGKQTENNIDSPEQQAGSNEVSGDNPKKKTENSDDKIAEEKYEKIRQNNVDVAAISKNLSLPPDLVERVKNHLFVEEHNFSESEGRNCFVPNRSYAELWQKAEAGKGNTEHHMTDEDKTKILNLITHENVEDKLENELKLQMYEEPEGEDGSRLFRARYAHDLAGIAEYNFKPDLVEKMPIEDRDDRLRIMVKGAIEVRGREYFTENVRESMHPRAREIYEEITENEKKADK